MRTVKIGEQELGLRATPLALLYYRQEFDKDLVADLASLEKLAHSLEKGGFGEFDSIKFLQITYVMNKAHRYKEKNFPKFDEWLAELDSIDFSDADFLMDVINEAIDGFFRSVSGGQKGQKK